MLCLILKTCQLELSHSYQASASQKESEMSLASFLA